MSNAERRSMRNTSTSVYEPGKKYSKTVNEYLGVLDEDARKIIPKKNRYGAQKILNDDTLTGRRFGGSYLLLDIVERIGLREDLFRSFGPDVERISPAPSRRHCWDSRSRPQRTRWTAA